MQDDVAMDKSGVDQDVDRFIEDKRRRELAAFNRRERARLDAICGQNEMIDAELRMGDDAADGELVVELRCEEGHVQRITTNLGLAWAKQWASIMDGTSPIYGGDVKDSTWIGVCNANRRAPYDSGPAATLEELAAQGGCCARMRARVLNPEGRPL